MSLPNHAQPAAREAMTDTEMTARLAEALFRIDTDCVNRGGLAGRSYDDVAAALLPVMREIADQRVVENARERLARWLFERDYRERGLASPEDAPWDEWVARNQDEWRAEADAVLDALRGEAGR